MAAGSILIGLHPLALEMTPKPPTRLIGAKSSTAFTETLATQPPAVGDADDGLAKPGARKLLQHLGPPILVLVLARLVIALAAIHWGGNPWDPEIYGRWDSRHYVVIARQGYHFRDCAVGEHLGPGNLCSNTAWFPLYPILLAQVANLGVKIQLAGAIISPVFALLTLQILWTAFFRGVWSARNGALLLLAGFFPGQIYHHALFPISMLTLLMLSAIALAARRRWALAGLMGGAATLAYPAGFLMAPVLGVAWLEQFVRRLKSKQQVDPEPPPSLTWKELVSATLAVLPSVIALGGWFLFLHGKFGHWDASLRVEATYGNAIHNPVDTLSFWLRPVWELPFPKNGPAWQTFLVLALVGTAVAFTLLNQSQAKPYDMTIMTLVLLLLVLPLVLGRGVSIYRVEALLLPVVFLLRHVRVQWLLLFLAGSVILAPVIATLFFNHSLI